jgi:hypothetical protein
MKQGPLGIFYLDYSDVAFPRSRRKLIIGYTRSDFLQKIQEKNIPDTYLCWLQECRTPGYLVEGNIETVRAWIDKHMSETFGDSRK